MPVAFEPDDASLNGKVTGWRSGTLMRSRSLTLSFLLLYLNSIVVNRNTVPERQRALQADPRPVFQRLPRSRLYMGLFMTLFGVGMYGTTVGFYNMAVVRIFLVFR